VHDARVGLWREKALRRGRKKPRETMAGLIE
jgi:hypothetical protein